LEPVQRKVIASNCRFPSLAPVLTVGSALRIPDSPQRPVRLRALKEGKMVYMAVPRLRELECFIELDPSRLRRNIKQAASIEGAFRFGRSVLPDNMMEIDLIVCGTVAVNLDGARIGKGGGYSDLEYGLARHVGLVRKTPVVTTVHDLQVLDEKVPVLVHDIPVDVISLRRGSFTRIHNCRGREEFIGTA
jgi:5-formyltetrahydrofolate cyclo-ligase